MYRTYYLRTIMLVYDHDPFFLMIQFIVILIPATYPQERSLAPPREAAHTHHRPRPKSQDPPNSTRSRAGLSFV